MSVRISIPATLIALLILGCSKNPSAAQSPGSAPQGSTKPTSAPTTIAIPANQDVATQVELPAGTYKVGMKTGAASFTCTNLQLVGLKGRNAKDEYFDVAEPINIPAHMNSTQTREASGDPFVLAYVRCHGGAADSQLVITPM